MHAGAHAHAHTHTHTAIYLSQPWEEAAPSSSVMLSPCSLEGRNNEPAEGSDRFYLRDTDPNDSISIIPRKSRPSWMGVGGVLWGDSRHWDVRLPFGTRSSLTTKDMYALTPASHKSQTSSLLYSLPATEQELLQSRSSTSPLTALTRSHQPIQLTSGRSRQPIVMDALSPALRFIIHMISLLGSFSWGLSKPHVLPRYLTSQRKPSFPVLNEGREERWSGEGNAGGEGGGTTHRHTQHRSRQKHLL